MKSSTSTSSLDNLKTDSKISNRSSEQTFDFKQYVTQDLANLVQDNTIPVDILEIGYYLRLVETIYGEVIHRAAELKQYQAMLQDPRQFGSSKNLTASESVNLQVAINNKKNDIINLLSDLLQQIQQLLGLIKLADITKLLSNTSTTIEKVIKCISNNPKQLQLFDQLTDSIQTIKAAISSQCIKPNDYLNTHNPVHVHDNYLLEQTTDLYNSDGFEPKYVTANNLYLLMRRFEPEAKTSFERLYEALITTSTKKGYKALFVSMFTFIETIGTICVIDHEASNDEKKHEDYTYLMSQRELLFATKIIFHHCLIEKESDSLAILKERIDGTTLKPAFEINDLVIESETRPGKFETPSISHDALVRLATLVFDEFRKSVELVNNQKVNHNETPKQVIDTLCITRRDSAEIIPLSSKKHKSPSNHNNKHYSLSESYENYEKQVKYLAELYDILYDENNRNSSKKTMGLLCMEIPIGGEAKNIKAIKKIIDKKPSVTLGDFTQAIERETSLKYLAVYLQLEQMQRSHDQPLRYLGKRSAAAIALQNKLIQVDYSMIKDINDIKLYKPLNFLIRLHEELQYGTSWNTGYLLTPSVIKALKQVVVEPEQILINTNFNFTKSKKLTEDMICKVFRILHKDEQEQQAKQAGVISTAEFQQVPTKSLKNYIRGLRDTCNTMIKLKVQDPSLVMVTDPDLAKTENEIGKKPTCNTNSFYHQQQAKSENNPASNNQSISNIPE